MPGAFEPSPDAAESLLSLSMAAERATPIPIAKDSSRSSSDDSAVVGNLGTLGSSFGGANSIPTSHTFSSTGLSASSGKHHRRLSSTGGRKRRLSDARDAASRPSSLLSVSPGLSLATLSLSSSPPPQGVIVAAQSQQQPISSVESVMSLGNASGITSASVKPGPGATPIPIGKPGKKRGVDHKCESCSKIYRHPVCLIKHRWEHTPHWRESSKYVLNKHQQVQLLEAAAILSHLSPTSSSLPEDRSLWPSFLSGGALPPPEGASLPESSTLSHPTSSSVPRATSTGPRLHDYSIPSMGNHVQVGPGLVGVPTNGTGAMSASAPMAVPLKDSHPRGAAGYYRGRSTGAASANGDWTLPSSDLRSMSSGDDDESDIDVDVDGDDASLARYLPKKDESAIEEEWDGEMEMEMD